ncbi:MAG: PLP-dependent aminotransferase family protein [Rhodocyclales bacterium]|nr:PLP-dependent aminotransferase family protein [Rhodocyclales bacterium]
MLFDALLDEINGRLAEPGDVPRQERLYRLLKDAVLAGRLGPGARLPATRTVAARCQMARNCVAYAFEALVAEGFLVADRQGTRVAELPRAAALAGGEGLPGLSRRGAGLRGRSVQHTVLPFAPGVPDLNLFPWQAWSRCLQRAWGEVRARELNYAPPGGEPALRAAVAHFLAGWRGVRCTPDEGFILAGAQQALEACARLLADPGDRVWVEEPGYPVARATLQGAGLVLEGVPVDGDGICIQPADWHTRPPRLVCVTPAHQFPLGSVLSLERRLALMAGARAAGAWVIEDDYDCDFYHGAGRPLPALQGLVADGPVIYLGTFSKLMYPGLRLAYLVLPRSLAPDFGEALAGWQRAGQAVEQRALAQFMESGALLRHHRQMAPVYRARQEALRAALAAHFPGWSVRGGVAGLHLVLEGAASLDDRAWAQAIATRSVVARPLSVYGMEPLVSPRGLVLGYGVADARQIPALVARLAEARF